MFGCDAAYEDNAVRISYLVGDIRVNLSSFNAFKVGRIDFQGDEWNMSRAISCFKVSSLLELIESRLWEFMIVI